MATMARCTMALLLACSAGGALAHAHDEWAGDVMGPEDASGLCDSSRMERAMIAERAVMQLRESGDFEVIKGNLTFNKQQIGNPVGKYGTIRFPHWAFPPLFCNISGGAKANSSVPWVFSFCDLSFTLGPRDAVVWLGCTPPPCAYFSLRSYVAFRFKPAFHFAAAELGDPANQLTINTTGEGDSFSKTTLLVSTADAETERLVHKAFKAGGMPASAINTDVLPHDIVHFRDRSKTWARDRSDGLAWQFRVSESRDEEKNKEYLQTAWPVYLVRAKRHYNKAKPKPLAPRPLRPRGTGETERESFADPVAKLAEKAIARMEKEGAKLVGRFSMSHNIPDLAQCLADPKFMPIFEPVPEWGFPGLATCDWFTRDALYTLLSRDKTDPNMLYFPPQRVWVVLGVNQPLVHKSAYSNFMLTCIHRFEDPAHSFNLTSSELVGSGAALSTEVPSADKLFAYTFRRACPPSDRFCREVPQSFINYTEPIFFVERKYLEEATKIGPAPEEVLEPLILAFDLPSSSAFSGGVDSPMSAIGEASAIARASLRGVAEAALTAET